MKKLIFIIFLISSNLQAMPTVIIDGNLTWIPPTEMTDGTTLTGSMTYAIYCNAGPGPFTAVNQITEISETQIALKDLALTGPQICAVTAKVNSTESVFSNTVNFTCNGPCLYGNGPIAPIIKIE